MTYEDINKEHEIDACISHFIFVSREATNKVGKWDEDVFFLYGEDIDYCFRIKECGYKLMYLPQFEAEHWKGATIGIRKETKDVVTRVSTINFRNKELSLGDFRIELRRLSTVAMEAFYRKHYFSKYPFLLSVLVITTIKVFKFFRITKQRLVNWKKGIK
jgi:hypothetical protein